MDEVLKWNLKGFSQKILYRLTEHMQKFEKSWINLDEFWMLALLQNWDIWGLRLFKNPVLIEWSQKHLFSSFIQNPKYLRENFSVSILNSQNHQICLNFLHVSEWNDNLSTVNIKIWIQWKHFSQATKNKIERKKQKSSSNIVSYCISNGQSFYIMTSLLCAHD